MYWDSRQTPKCPRQTGMCDAEIIMNSEIDCKENWQYMNSKMDKSINLRAGLSEKQKKISKYGKSKTTQKRENKAN